MNRYTDSPYHQSPPLAPSLPESGATPFSASTSSPTPASTSAPTSPASSSSSPPPPTRPPRHQLRSAEEYPAEQLEGTAYHIPKNEYPNGFDLQWCAVEVWQQPQPSMWNEYHRMGWEPVLAGDFDGMYDGRFLPREHVGEIKLDGLILCARPMSWSIQAREKALREARGQVSIKVAQLRRGDLDGVTLDSTHKSALAHNTIGSEFEGIRLPAPAPDK